ncbi:Crp/Fnr family transcriptional regulator [Reinekea sp. G2M2-21]|uniref:Crp/Fnr family transcriptional regulator n=1 Tax=Reinekea sp. G2M2-21 TaxID=2788942 RepID=UPI0018A9154D|nr:cyclic nucleotide-binding domain-containing protein [Reinekea sp. G2M2-21]
MLLMVKHPESWIHKAQTQQFFALKNFDAGKSTRMVFKREELAETPAEDWALVRVVDGLIGLKMDDNRVMALESGDCWLGYPGGVMQWYQEGAVTLDVWTWKGVPQAVIPSVIHGFSDLVMSLLNHNTQVPPDPMPGFEFFKSGEEIIKEGESADSVYTLIQGKAKVTVQGKQVGVAKENEIIGLQAMLLKTTRTATVVADGPCSAVRVAYDKFRSLIETRPELVLSTMETMAQQIERANKRMTE